MNKNYSKHSQAKSIARQKISRQEAAYIKQKNPLNFSKSKMQYSFARAVRFSQQDYFQAEEYAQKQKNIQKYQTKDANLANKKVQIEIAQMQQKTRNKSRQRYRFYNLPSQLSKRATSFGYGSRSTIGAQTVKPMRKIHRNSTMNIQKMDNNFYYASNQNLSVFYSSPTPTRYNIASCFQKDNKILGCKDKGVKFKCGRQQVKYGSNFIVNQNPGPGNYNPNPEVISGAKKIAYSLGKRFESRRCKSQYGNRTNDQASNDKGFTIYDETPGPIYQIPTTMLDKNKILSKYVRKGCTRIVEPTNLTKNCSKTFYSKNQYNATIDSKTEIKGQSTPGPQQYQLSVITRKGERSIGQIAQKVFMTQERRFKHQDISENLPGPGHYQAFSEFIQL